MHSSLPRTPFTREAYEKMQQERDALIPEREEVIIRLKAAREMGDLSENGAYKYAKFELGRISRRLKELHHFLSVGIIVEKSADPDQIGFGSQVTLFDSKKDHLFLIVSEHESNPAEQKLSMKSPIGSALLGKKKGDSIVVQAPMGEIKYLVKNIE